MEFIEATGLWSITSDQSMDTISNYAELRTKNKKLVLQKQYDSIEHIEFRYEPRIEEVNVLLSGNIITRYTMHEFTVDRHGIVRIPFALSDYITTNLPIVFEFVTDNPEEIDVYLKFKLYRMPHKIEPNNVTVPVDFWRRYDDIKSIRVSKYIGCRELVLVNVPREVERIEITACDNHFTLYNKSRRLKDIIFPEDRPQCWTVRFDQPIQRSVDLAVRCFPESVSTDGMHAVLRGTNTIVYNQSLRAVCLRYSY